MGLTVEVGTLVTTIPWPTVGLPLDVYKVEDDKDKNSPFYYVPLRHLAPVLGKTFTTLSKAIGGKTNEAHVDAIVEFIKAQVGGSKKPILNYTPLSLLATYLVEKGLMPSYSVDGIVSRLKGVEFRKDPEQAKKPHKKRTRNSGDIEEEGDDYSKGKGELSDEDERQVINIVEEEERDEEEEEIPPFMKRFLQEVDARIGSQAIAAYQVTDEFNRRVGDMFDEMELEVRKRLEMDAQKDRKEQEQALKTEMIEKRKQMEEALKGEMSQLRKRLEQETRADFEQNTKPKLIQELQAKTVQQVTLQTTTQVSQAKELVQAFAESRKTKNNE